MPSSPYCPMFNVYGSEPGNVAYGESAASNVDGGVTNNPFSTACGSPRTVLNIAFGLYVGVTQSIIDRVQ